jgi:flagellar biogenesis protein FliO
MIDTKLILGCFLVLLIVIGLIVFGAWFVKKISSRPEEDFKDWDITLMDGLKDK